MSAATLSYPSSGLTGSREAEFRIDIDDELLPRPVTSHSVVEDDYSSKVRSAAERLAVLKQEATELERERQEFQALAEKQHEFAKGRTEMEDVLTRTLVTVEREGAESRRRLQLCLDARDDYARHLEALRGIRPDDWNRAELAEELDRALGVIQAAKLDWQRSEAQLDAFRDAPGATSARTLQLPDFKTCLRAGFAFSLPLIITALVASLLLVIF